MSLVWYRHRRSISVPDEDICSDAGRNSPFHRYTGNDRAWAEWIAWQLKEAGFEIKIQAWDFGAGAHFAEEMHSATTHAKQTIAVLSPDFLKSAYAAPEWQAAFVKDPQGKQRKLVPVRVRPCQPDGLLQQIVYIDLVGLDRESARERLLREIQGGGPPPSEPDFPGQVTSSQPKKNPSGSEPPFPVGVEFLVDYSFREFSPHDFLEKLQEITQIEPELAGANQTDDGKTLVSVVATSQTTEPLATLLRESQNLVVELADTAAVRRITWFQDHQEHVIFVPDAEERKRRTDWLETVRLELLEELNLIDHDRAMQELARLCKLESQQDDLCESISRRLVRRPDAIGRMGFVRRLLKNRRADLERLEAIEDVLLPVWFGPEISNRLYGELTVNGVLLVEKTVATTCGLEYAMAAFDCRAVEFAEAGQGKPESLCGSLLVRHVPAAPKAPEIDESVLDIIADLAAQLLPPELLPETELAMEEQETGEYRPRVTQELLPIYAQRLNDVLATYADEFGSPYCAVRMPDSEVQRGRRLQVLSRLRQLVPA